MDCSQELLVVTLPLLLDSFNSFSSPQKIAWNPKHSSPHQIIDHVMLLCSDKQLNFLFLSGKNFRRLYTKAISILQVLPGPAGRELSLLALDSDKHCKGRGNKDLLFRFVLFCFFPTSEEVLAVRMLETLLRNTITIILSNI